MRNPLLSLCKDFNVDAFIFVGTDPHQLEYPPDKFKIRHRLSNFYGSAGSFVIFSSHTQIHKALWTDGRYEIEASQCVAPDCQVFISRENDWAAQIKWIISKLNVGVDPPIHTSLSIRVGCINTLFTVHDMKLILEHMEHASSQHQLSVEPIFIPFHEFIKTLRIVSPKIYATLSQDFTPSPIFLLDALQRQKLQRDSTVTSLRASRISQLRNWMSEQQIDVYLSASPHELAWLLYIRSLSISYLMVFPCFFIFNNSHSTLKLFIPQELHFEKNEIYTIQKEIECSIELLDYNLALSSFHKFTSEIYNLQISYDPHILPHSHYHSDFRKIDSPISEWKSISSDMDLEDFKQCQQIDHIALIEAMAEIYEYIQKGKKITEQDVSDLVCEYRKKSPLFLQESFQSISASSSHAALPHYNCGSEPKIIDPLSPFLFDSGAHYLLGTTDLTRVYYFQDKVHKIDPLYIEDYTYVLKSHIALAQYSAQLAHIPEMIPMGKELDECGRGLLIQSGRNFNHGIGHGVGYCTDVHEGIQKIGPNSSQKIFPHMIISNEPGFYRPSQWGIRIENLICANLDEHNTYYFETLTFFPIQASLINFSLLNESEKEWLSSYHQRCKEQLAPRISNKATRYLEFLCSSEHKK